MARAKRSAETSIDLDAVFDSALANPKPKSRMLTKTQQLRDRREKLIALRAKGYTELELAQMAGVSKDTLRKALHPESSTKPKKPKRVDENPAQTAPKKQDQKATNTPSRAPNVAGVNSNKKPFPTKDRF